jgi:hypothetical protein
MKHFARSSDDSIDFDDARSKSIHAELKSKDKDGNYASFFKQVTHQFLQSDVNTVPPGYHFCVDRIASVEVYSSSDKERLRKLLIKMARRMNRRDAGANNSVVENIERAIDTIASEKKSRSYHFIDGLVVPTGSKLFTSYRVKIESIGAFLIRVYFLLEPSASLQEQIQDISRKQTNTRVKIFLSWLKKFKRIQNPSFVVKKGNRLKQDLIKDLDDRIRSEIYTIFRRDAPGILAGNYSGIPILMAYRCQSAINASESCTTENQAHRSEFFRLFASAGADSHDIYENSSTNDVYIEQKQRSGNEPRILGKLISFSDTSTVILEQILWVNTLKEILRLQSRQLDDLQNKVIMLSIQKTRESLASQRLQLYQHVSVYETFTSAHDQERDADTLISEQPDTGLIWEPLPGKKYEYYEHGLETIQWLRKLIDDQIPRLKESYLIAKDEFSDRTILRLTRLAIFLAIIVPISQIGLQRVVDHKFPISLPSPAKTMNKDSVNQPTPSSTRDLVVIIKSNNESTRKSQVPLPNNKIQRSGPQ